MTIEALIIEKFGQLFNNRLWWDTTPDGMLRTAMDEPFAIVEEIGGQFLKYVDNIPHEFANTNLQFTIWGSQRLAVGQKRNELCALALELSDGTFYAMPSGEGRSTYNEILKLRGSIQEMRVWYPNPIHPAP